jgi:hypothetical protein
MNLTRLINASNYLLPNRGRPHMNHKCERGRFVMPVPLRDDFEASQSRVIARTTKDAPQARRRRLIDLAQWIFEAFRISVAKQTLITP